MRKELHWAFLEKSSDAEDACEARNDCCEDEKGGRGGALKEWIDLTLELIFQVVLKVGCTNAELDDQLCDTLNKRFKGGDVPHVVGAPLHPLWVVD